MAINRGPYNALIDDDGSGTTGTPWNKARIAGVLLDPIDAMFNPLLLPGTAPYIGANTVDGADNQLVSLTGGGFTDVARGGTVRVFGNEHVQHGDVWIQTGNHALARFVLYRGDNTTAIEDFPGSPGGLNLHARPGGLIQLIRSDGNAALVLNGSTGNINIQYGLQLAPPEGTLSVATADGADTGVLALCGGGANSNARGAVIGIYGNEAAGVPGSIGLYLGNVAGAALRVHRSDSVAALMINGATGNMTVDAALNVTGNATVTGVLTVTGGLGSTSLNASQLTNGTVPDARLSSTVALKTTPNTFTQSQTMPDATVRSLFPLILLQSDNDPVNNRKFYLENWNQQFRIVAYNDDRSALQAQFGVSRTGEVIIGTSSSQPLILDTTSSSGGFCQWSRSGVAVGQVGTPAAFYGGYTGADFMVRANNILLLQSALGTGARIDAPPVYSNTIANAANVNVDSNGTLRRSTSSVRYKRAIEPLAADWRALLALRPVSFEHIAIAGVRYVGLLAEEVAAIDPRLAVCGADGQPEEVAYAHLTAPLLAAIQDLHARLTALERGSDGT